MYTVLLANLHRRSDVVRWRLAGVCTVLLMIFLLAPLPAYAQAEGAQTDSHVVDVPLEATLDGYYIDVTNVLPPGPTTFNVINNTDLPHGLTIVGEGIEPALIEDLTPGESIHVDRDLQEGVYLIYNPEFAYAALGMETVVFVTSERINLAVEDQDTAEGQDTDTQSNTAQSSDAMTDTQGITATATLTAAARGPLLETATEYGLNTFAEALRAANLEATLAEGGPYTIFAPSNEAFAALPQETLDQYMSEPEGFLTQILRYHVVEGRYDAADLNDSQLLQTLQGDAIVVAIEPEEIRVNEGAIMVRDIATDNGVIHVIDRVLMPVAEEAADADEVEAEGAITSQDPVNDDEVPGGEAEIDDTATMTGTESTGDTSTGDASTDYSPIVLQVGERMITRADFDQLFLRTLSNIAAQSGLPLDSVTQPVVEELRQRFLAQLALRETLLAEAARRGLTVSDAEIENLVLNAKQNFDDDTEFAQALNLAGYADEAAYRMALREEGLLGQVIDMLQSETSVSEEEIETFYRDNRDLFRTGPGVILPLIQVEDQIRQMLEMNGLQEVVAGLQQEMGVEVFAGNLSTLDETLQQLPGTEASTPMTATATMTETATMTGTMVTTDTISGLSDVRTATATLMNIEGEVVGNALFTQTNNGTVELEVELNGDPALGVGAHGIHIHTTGACTPDFAAAGGHFNPTNAQHGLENPDGPHAGDLPNLEINADGTSSYTVETDRITLGDGEISILDADGSALVIHTRDDDQTSDPSGESGNRIACGVIEPGTHAAADAAD